MRVTRLWTRTDDVLRQAIVSYIEVLMRHLIGVRAALAALWLAMPLALASAQDPRRLATPDSIPVELATALIAAGGVGGIGGEPIITVGSFPEWVTNRIALPKSARILGAAIAGNTIVGIYSVNATVDAAVAELKTTALSRGWTSPPSVPVYGGGFRPATMAPQTQQGGPTNRATVCREDGSLFISGAPARGGGTNVTVRLISRSGPTSYDTCHQPPRPEMPGNRSAMPTLYDPPITGAPAAPSVCYPSYNNSTGTSTYIRTTLSPELVLDHYATQLRDSGCTVIGTALPPASRTFTRHDSTGAPIEMTLTVAGSPKDPNCRDVSMQVRGPAKP